MARVAIGDAGWVVLREPKKVPERLRRPLKEHVGMMGGAENLQAAATEVFGDHEPHAVMTLGMIDAENVRVFE